MGVLHAHAEAQGPHRIQVGDLVCQFAQDQAQAGVVGGVEVGEGLGGVAVAAPFDPRQVGAVVEAEVVEGAEQALLQGAPEAQLGGDAAVKPMEDVLAAGALGGGGEAQQQNGRQVAQPALVAGGGGVVELIDDHHGERVRRQVRRIQPSERLHRGEHMAPLAGALAIHQQLAEGAIAQHLAEGGEALLQDLAPVGHEQQARVTRTGLAGVIEGGDHGFARAGGGHHQVAPAAMEAALGGELFEDLLLVGVGADVEEAERGGVRRRVPRRLLAHGPIKAALLDLAGPVGLELALLPVALKGGLELGQDALVVVGGEAHVPLQAVVQGGGGEVGGADVGGGGRGGAREARPMEQPGFGVQAGAAGVVADAHLGAVGHQPIEGAAVGGAQVDGGEHPQRAAGLGLQELRQRRLEQAQAAPLDEGAEQVDPLGGGDFVDQRLPHRRFAAGVHQQGAVGQGDERADGFGLAGEECRGPDLREQPGGAVQPVGCGDGAGCLALEQAHQLVHQGQLVLRGGATAQVLQGNAGQTRQVPGQQARGFLGIQAVLVIEIARQLAQLLLQALGEELLVEAGRWDLVGHGIPGACAPVLAVDRQPGIGLGCGDVMRIRIT